MMVAKLEKVRFRYFWRTSSDILRTLGIEDADAALRILDTDDAKSLLVRLEETRVAPEVKRRQIYPLSEAEFVFCIQDNLAKWNGALMLVFSRAPYAVLECNAGWFLRTAVQLLQWDASEITVASASSGAMIAVDVEVSDLGQVVYGVVVFDGTDSRNI